MIADRVSPLVDLIPLAYRADEDIRHWTSSTTAAFAHPAGIRKAKNKHDWLRPVARLLQAYFSFLNFVQKIIVFA